MATLDQLPAEQRAIVELVVQRGRSYDALADVLQVPSSRVQELARDALSELSPRTARRVDPEWRGKVADYLLGQQSAADARATRDHLKQSESSRAWALSLLDSLDPLYGDGSPPAVPEGPEDVEEEPAAAKPAARAAAAKPARGNGAGAAETVEERTRARQRERDRERDRDRERPLRLARDEDEEDDARPARKKEPLRKTEERERSGSLSPAAQEALRRRRIRGAGLGVALLVVIVLAILAITGAFSSDDKGGGSGSTGLSGASATSTTAAGNNPLQLLGQIALGPLNKSKAQGIVYLAQENKQRFLVVQAQVPPLPKSQKVAAYEVWLYNTNADAKSLGAQYTDAKGLLQGRANLPANYARYKFIDISREVVSDNNAGHGNASVLRGAFASIAPVPQQQQQGGASTTPGAGASTTPGTTTPAP